MENFTALLPVAVLTVQFLRIFENRFTITSCRVHGEMVDSSFFLHPLQGSVVSLHILALPLFQNVVTDFSACRSNYDSPTNCKSVYWYLVFKVLCAVFTGYVPVGFIWLIRLDIRFNGLHRLPFRINASLTLVYRIVNTFFQFFSKHKNPLRVFIM